MVAALALYSGAAFAADAPKPEVKSVAPLGVQAGRTTTVLIYGENLTPKEVVADKTPLTAKLLEVKTTEAKQKERGTKKVVVQVTVPANCPRAALSLTLIQPDGVKINAAIAIVDDVATEVEARKPAATFAQAMPLPGTSVAVTGTLDNDSAALFRFDARAGETWDISVLAGRGGSQLDPVVRVRDPRHYPLALSAGDKKKDRHIVFHVPADGIYYIDITDEQARGGPGYDYRLTVRR